MRLDSLPGSVKCIVREGPPGNTDEDTKHVVLYKNGEYDEYNQVMLPSDDRTRWEAPIFGSGNGRAYRIDRTCDLFDEGPK